MRLDCREWRWFEFICEPTSKPSGEDQLTVRALIFMGGSIKEHSEGASYRPHGGRRKFETRFTLHLSATSRVQRNATRRVQVGPYGQMADGGKDTKGEISTTDEEENWIDDGCPGCLEGGQYSFVREWVLLMMGGRGHNSNQ